MAKLRDNIEDKLPFISVINYGEEEFVGIIINQDQFVTSFYDLNAIKTFNSKDVRIILGPTVNLMNLTLKRVKRKSVQLVRRPR